MIGHTPPARHSSAASASEAQQRRARGRSWSTFRSTGPLCSSGSTTAAPNRRARGDRLVATGGSSRRRAATLGPVTGLRIGEPATRTIAGIERAGAGDPHPVQRGPTGCSLVATYPRSALERAIDSQRLRILVPLILLALIVGVLAFAAADRMSRALNDLAERAPVLARGRPAATSSTSSAPRSTRSRASSPRAMGELEAERGRFKETLQRYGETLAATHDLNALVGAVLDTAVQATRARGGRLLLYDAERGEAIEQARIGTARGPALRPAHGRRRRRRPRGRGARDARAACQPGAARDAGGADPARAPPARPRHRRRPGGRRLLATTTSSRSRRSRVQAGVAIENARLHRVVERQAVHRRAHRARQPAPVLRGARPRVRARPAVRPARSR